MNNILRALISLIVIVLIGYGLIAASIGTQFFVLSIGVIGFFAICALILLVISIIYSKPKEDEVKE